MVNAAQILNGSVALRDCLTSRDRCLKTVRCFQVGNFFSPIYNKSHTGQNMEKQRINPLLAQKTQIPRTPSASAARVLQKLHNGRLCRPLSFAGRPPKTARFYLLPIISGVISIKDFIGFIFILFSSSKTE